MKYVLISFSGRYVGKVFGKSDENKDRLKTMWIKHVNNTKILHLFIFYTISDSKKELKIILNSLTHAKVNIPLLYDQISPSYHTL